MISPSDQKGTKGKIGRRWGQKIPLFWAIAFWVLAASVLFLLLATILWSLFINDPNTPGVDFLATEEGRDPVKFVQTILAAVGGIGAVGYLVIKYRERSEAETSMADQRLLEAVNQLGSESPQVRIAGVYALADIADTFRGPYKQRVVDILCGYLRTDRSDGDVQQADTSTSIRFRDAAVESTVLDVIESHVRKTVDAAKSWSECDFDIHGALLHEDIPFMDTSWRGVFVAEGTQFMGKVFFNEASFGDWAIFRGSSFGGWAIFKGSSFGDRVFFREASFGDLNRPGFCS